MIGMVKVCGLTDRDAVEAAVNAGVDAIGFVFAPSVRQVSPELAAELSDGCPAAVRRVAVMQHPAPDDWNNVCEIFKPNVLQTDAEDFVGLNIPADIECWPVIREGNIVDDVDLPKIFLYEGRHSGQGETVNWQQAARYAKRGRMILAGGLSADNVAAAIREVLPWGVDVSSAVESAPGKKNPEKIAAFVRAARSL
ncbi:MAG: phosphoribosylanthranilate isomerase [Woeseia sp.]|nr:phosphoribosylanthranilate isomerase [Woeseia sp.]MBT8097009.1 phosphoribosylanthranilate isomerase [Woeseia sp.]NNE59722.1 phosphoribosylanthranilate isomerase [Woeseia sp.]NNL54747.1 phosphoribosylanthranilate isomerase [Woeseia sp.]